MILIEKEIHLRNGFCLTLLLSTALLVIFYGGVMSEANNVYFSNAGDGLQSYYSTLYQVKHDSTYWRMSGMNYPYGESSFFTGNQPLLTAFIKLISNNFYDISGYSIGIINLFMLLSILLCSLAIFGIFHHLGLPWWYCALTAVGITFLSPQIQRMGGHFSLAYPFAIPLFMLMIFKFYDDPSIKRTITIGVFTFIMAGTHLYFFGIFALLMTLFYIFCFAIQDKKFKNFLFSLKHYSLQVIVPFLSIWGLMSLNNNVTDRPESPLGFLHYRSAWEGVLLPIGRPLGNLINSFIEIRHVEWEGRAFVGMAATIFTIILLVCFFSLLFKKRFKQIFIITDHPVLNIIFWSSIIGLLYSFGLPFILKMDFLIDYLGILKQMRGIARFSWIFFYAINIVTFYLLFKWASQKIKYYKNLFLVLPLSLLFIDVWYSVCSHEFFLNNKIEKLNSDSPDDIWSKQINSKHYQAIIPLPYFAVGSENLWILPDQRIIYETLIASYQSGIPTTGAMLARTSLSQTFKHLQMVQEPYRALEISDDLTDERPFLVLSIEDLVSDSERGILNESKHILSTKDFSLYELPVSVLKNRAKFLYEKTLTELQGNRLFSNGPLLSTDSAVHFVYEDFEGIPESITYSGKGAFKGKLYEKSTIFEGNLPYAISGEKHILSFWFHGFRNDIYPRTIIQLEFSDKDHNESKIEKREVQQHIKIIDKDWALIEFDFMMPENTSNLRISLLNNQLKESSLFYADDFLIRPFEKDLYKIKEDTIFKNSRYYINNFPIIENANEENKSIIFNAT